MKKSLLLILFALLTFVANAQYQLLNPSFESWEGSSTTAKPSYWSSFPQSDGSWAWAARTAQHYHRNGGRPGTSGSSFITIYSRNVMGVTANGNMTTGQVHAGSTSASSSSNYNYTHRGSYAHPFSGTPDSMYVWVSYYAASTSSQASVHAYIHGDSDFIDPNDCNTPSLYKGSASAEFTRTTSSNSAYSWEQKRVPFSYTGTSSVNYILMSMTTNATPGGGSANDSLSVDDIEFIYSAWLEDISINGNTIEGFILGNLDYSITTDNLSALTSMHLQATPQADDATLTIDSIWLDNNICQWTINVTAEDSVTSHTYTVTISAAETLCDTISNPNAQVAGNSCIISWTPGQGNTLWNVRYGLASQDCTLWQDTMVNTPTLELFNLSSGTDYETQIRAVCNDSLGLFSEWSTPIRFSTPSDTTVQIAERLPENIICYPNPTTGMIHLQSDLHFTHAILYNLQGQKIETFSNTSSFDISHTPNGTYKIVFFNKDTIIGTKTITHISR